LSAQQEDCSAAISFVKLIEQNPCLWNYSLKTYSRTDITGLAWREIAKKLNDTGKKNSLHLSPVIDVIYQK
jgi:hypothetical protein